MYSTYLLGRHVSTVYRKTNTSSLVDELATPPVHDLDASALSSSCPPGVALQELPPQELPPLSACPRVASSALSSSCLPRCPRVASWSCLLEPMLQARPCSGRPLPRAGTRVGRSERCSDTSVLEKGVDEVGTGDGHTGLLSHPLNLVAVVIRDHGAPKNQHNAACPDLRGRWSRSVS